MATDTGENEAGKQTKRKIVVINLDSDEECISEIIEVERTKRAKRDDKEGGKKEEEDVKVEIVESRDQEGEEGERRRDQAQTQTEVTEGAEGNYTEGNKEEEIGQQDDVETGDGVAKKRTGKKIRRGSRKKKVKLQDGKAGQTDEQAGEEEGKEGVSDDNSGEEEGQKEGEGEEEGEMGRQEEAGNGDEVPNKRSRVRRGRHGNSKKKAQIQAEKTHRTEEQKGEDGTEAVNEDNRGEEEGGKEVEGEKEGEIERKGAGKVDGISKEGPVKKKRQRDSKKKTKAEERKTSRKRDQVGEEDVTEEVSDNSRGEEEGQKEDGKEEGVEGGKGKNSTGETNSGGETGERLSAQVGSSEQAEVQEGQAKETEENNDTDEIEITSSRNVFGKRLPGRVLYGRFVQGRVFEIPDGSYFFAVVPIDADLHVACRSWVWPVTDGLRNALERRKRTHTHSPTHTQAGDSPPPPTYLIAIRRDTYIGVAQVMTPTEIHTNTNPPTVPIEWRMLREIEHTSAFNVNLKDQKKHLANLKYPPYASDGVNMGTMGGLSIVRALCTKGKDPLELIGIFDKIDLDEIHRNNQRHPMHPPGFRPEGPPHGFPPPMPNMGPPFPNMEGPMPNMGPLPFPPPHFNMRFPRPGGFRPPPPHSHVPFPGPIFRPGGDFPQGPPPLNSAPFDTSVLRSNPGLSAIDMLRNLTENSGASGGEHSGGPKWAMVLELSFLNDISLDFLRGALQRAQGHVKFVVPICLTDALDKKIHKLKKKPTAANELKYVKVQLRCILDICDERLGVLQLRSQDLAFCQSVNAQDTPEYDLARTCECAQRMTGFEPGHVVVLTQNTLGFKRAMKKVEGRQGGEEGGVENVERVPVGDLRLVGPREFADAGGVIEVALRKSSQQTQTQQNDVVVVDLENS